MREDFRIATYMLFDSSRSALTLADELNKCVLDAKLELERSENIVDEKSILDDTSVVNMMSERDSRQYDALISEFLSSSVGEVGEKSEIYLACNRLRVGLHKLTHSLVRELESLKDERSHEREEVFALRRRAIKAELEFENMSNMVKGLEDECVRLRARIASLEAAV